MPTTASVSGSSDVSGSNAVTRARPSTSPTGGQGSGISSVAQPNSSNTAAGTTTRSFMNTTRKTSTRQTLAVCPGPCKAVRSDARRMRTGHGGSVCAYCRPCSTSTARPMTKPPLAIRLAAPRGFCAGVTRAIQIVETCLEKYGAPVYVRHQIVHNQHVVRDLEARGAIFVKELDEVPDDRPVVFSAHGIPQAVTMEAERRDLVYFDATCPLVTKVHKSAARYSVAERMVILIGHAGHPEVVGTLGQLPSGRIALVESIEDVMALDFPADQPLAYITQTTLSVDDTATIVAALKQRFPRDPRDGGTRHLLCDHQPAERREDHRARLRRTDRDRGLQLLQLEAAGGSRAGKRLFGRTAALGCWRTRPRLAAGQGSGRITAGASAPDVLVRQLIEACGESRELTVEEVEITREDARFRLPRGLEV